MTLVKLSSKIFINEVPSEHRFLLRNHIYTVLKNRFQLKKNYTLQYIFLSKINLKNIYILKISSKKNKYINHKL